MNFFGYSVDFVITFFLLTLLPCPRAVVSTNMTKSRSCPCSNSVCHA